MAKSVKKCYLTINFQKNAEKLFKNVIKNFVRVHNHSKEDKEMSNEQKNNVRIVVYGLLCALLVIAVALIVAFTAPSGNKLNPEDPSEPTGNTPIVFTNPLDTTTVLMGFSDKELQYNASLNQWEAHKAMCFGAEADANVYAVFGGVVESVEKSYLMGTTITIKHNDQLSTVYSSLAQEPAVKEGDTVAKGQVIGKVASTAQAESAMGNHLHFEVLQNGKKVDPADFLTLEEK